MHSQECLKELNDYASQDDFNTNILPIINLIDPYHENKECLFSKGKLIFCHTAVLKTIESCLKGRYSDFDGHTTSNCCHGMALLSSLLIDSVLQLDLKFLQEEGENKLRELENCTDERQPCSWWIPQSLIYLASLFILDFIKEIDPARGARTSTKKLKLLGPISVNVCNQIAHDVQKYFANLIVGRYSSYLREIDGEMVVSGVPVAIWGKYVGSDYIRTDKRGVRYVSNLFSMQVVLGYLTHRKAKIAIINDIIDDHGNSKGRYVAIFEGDGKGNFRILSPEEIHFSTLFEKTEPVVVYGGCVYSDHLNLDSLSLLMQPWLDNLSNLLLACDVFYPQFFKIVDDSCFDSSPIAPSEDLLSSILSSHLTIPGVSAADPTLYCGTHILTASLSQVLDVLTGKNDKALPNFFIPGVKRESK